jgi:Flp pilus assembly protein CpaB
VKRTNLVVLLGLVALVVGASLAVVVARRHHHIATGVTAADGNGSVAVVVAAQPIPQGASGDDLIAGGAVRLDDVPSGQRLPDALGSLDQLRGRVLIASVATGAQVRVADLQAPVRTVTVPTGYQALAVSVPFVNGGAGYVRVGDTVNVYANLAYAGKPAACTELVVPNVQVLDVNQEVAPQVGTPQPGRATNLATSTVRPAGLSLTYLLAVGPAQAQDIIFMASNESLYFTLTHKGQAAPSALPCAGYAQLQKKP